MPTQITNENIASIVADIHTVASHVACNYNYDYASLAEGVAARILQEVDVDALDQVISWVWFASDFRRKHRALDAAEQRAFDAARRLDTVLHVVKARRAEISARVRAA